VYGVKYAVRPRSDLNRFLNPRSSQQLNRDLSFRFPGPNRQRAPSPSMGQRLHTNTN
jgi:hypothetical protein